jgi:isoaspartyl peptidase/L-asparaginase-like protein (Ntn-hydrolase superfamily)
MRKASKLTSLWVAASLIAAGANAESPLSCGTQSKYTIVVHGGYVGEAHPDWPDAAVRELTRQIVTRGRERLAAGASALDVVVESIVAFEDSGQTDSGKGSFENSAGFVETDASLMLGSSGRSGAVAAMQRLKNPILAARIVMEKTPHVLFVGAAGEQTLIDLGAQAVADPKTYYKPVAEPEAPKNQGHGTVGAVAMDRCGVLAAGTSTGGTYGKMPGRVGDSPIIGASTFANDQVALSATGAGEYFIKRGATRDIAARVAYLHMPLQNAADFVIKDLIGKEDHSRGAVIAISRGGEIAFSSTGYGLLHGYATEKLPPTVAVKVE